MWIQVSGRRETIIDIDWQPGIGDPTLSGWISVFAYFATAAICWCASVKARSRPVRHSPKSQRSSPDKEARFWIYVAAFMTFLGLNKQLDLQTLFTEIGRILALSSGWYDQRQTVQIIFILGLTILAACTAGIVFWTFRRLAVQIKMASIGICLLGAFIVIRAASFHHADRFLGQYVIGVRWNAVLELGCILFVAASGISYLKQRTIAR